MILQHHIAKRMKNAMSEEHLTIPELAEKIGVARSSVQMYLREEGNPRADTIELIYENLGHPLEKVMQGNEEMPEIEQLDFQFLADNMKSIHPLLKSVVVRSFQMAEDILELSDLLYMCGSGLSGDEL